MRKSTSIGTGAAVAAFLTHGMVYSAVHFDRPLPVSMYDAFFRWILLAIEQLWSHAHGWQPMSHIHDFGHFYAPVVQVICPLIGFAVFCAISRQKLGSACWKPLAIALPLTVVSSDGLPWVEAARTAAVVLLMVWSVGAISLGRRVQVALQS
jgi:hypothetical protein